MSRARSRGGTRPTATTQASATPSPRYRKAGHMLTRMRRGHRTDAGVTLVIAMMVMGVVSVLSLVVVSAAIKTNQDSGRDRQRTVTVNAAEAGVDAVYASIQSSGTTLPCRWPATGTATMNASPDQATA